LLAYQWAPFAKFSDGVDPDGHDFGGVALGHEVVDDGAQHRLDRVRRNHLVSSLGVNMYYQQLAIFRRKNERFYLKRFYDHFRAIFTTFRQKLEIFLKSNVMIAFWATLTSFRRQK
jgi:hypothetical protein